MQNWSSTGHTYFCLHEKSAECLGWCVSHHHVEHGAACIRIRIYNYIMIYNGREYIHFALRGCHYSTLEKPIHLVGLLCAALPLGWWRPGAVFLWLQSGGRCEVPSLAAFVFICGASKGAGAVRSKYERHK